MRNTMTLRSSDLKENLSPEALIFISIFQMGEETQRDANRLASGLLTCALSTTQLIRSMYKQRVNRFWERRWGSMRIVILLGGGGELPWWHRA